MKQNTRVLLLTWLALMTASVVTADDVTRKETRLASESQSTFLRLRKNDQGEPIAMESAVVRYTSADHSREALEVDLIAAIHLGDTEYYRQINRLFQSYDVVLYELIAPEGTVIPKGGAGAGTHPVGMMQVRMKSLLDLSFQLEEIDYTRKNLVRADMSVDEFSKSMSDRGESFLQLFFRMMGHAMAMQGSNSAGSSDVQMLAALFAPDRHLRLKRVMAEQFAELGGVIPGLDGPDGSTIVTERNAKAIEVLKRQIAAGKKSIAIFYGAGHMPDMQQRLLKDIGLKRQSARWLASWNLAPEDTSTKTEGANGGAGED